MYAGIDGLSAGSVVCGASAGLGSEQARARRLRREVRALAAREARVSRAVAAAELTLSRLSADHGALAYITYADLRSIKDFRNQTVIPIKAPPDTRLSVSFILIIIHYINYKNQHRMFKNVILKCFMALNVHVDFF